MNSNGFNGKETDELESCGNPARNLQIKTLSTTLVRLSMREQRSEPTEPA